MTYKTEIGTNIEYGVAGATLTVASTDLTVTVLLDPNNATALRDQLNDFIAAAAGHASGDVVSTTTVDPTGKGA